MVKGIRTGIALGVGALASLCLVGCSMLGLTLEGDRLLRQGEIDAAIAAYHQSLGVRSSQKALQKLKEAESLKAEALIDAASLAASRSNHEEAFLLLSDALALNPKSIEALDALALSREALHREAAEDLNLGRHEHALGLYALILSQYHRDSLAQDGAQNARYLLAEDATAKAHRVAKTSHGAAFFGFMMALNVDPTHEGAQAGVRAMTLALEEDLKGTLGVEHLEDAHRGQAQEIQRCCQETVDRLLQEIEELEAAGWTNPALDRRLLLFLWTGQGHYIADSVTSMGISEGDLRSLLKTSQ